MVLRRIYWDDGYGGSNTQTFEGRTDASGRHYLDMEFVEAEEPRPYSVFASADVMDVNRQAWNAGTSLLVHPSVALRGAAQRDAPSWNRANRW